jgi:hypothetical protein
LQQPARERREELDADGDVEAGAERDDLAERGARRRTEPLACGDTISRLTVSTRIVGRAAAVGAAIARIARVAGIALLGLICASFSSRGTWWCRRRVF